MDSAFFAWHAWGEVVSTSFFVLEDDPVVARTLWRLLHGLGEIVPAASVTAGLRLLEGERPWSALFIDIMLPDGSGLDVLERARAFGVDCPALVLTARYTPSDINRAFDLGARYLVKPFDSERILSFAREATSGNTVEEAARTWGWRYALTKTEVSILIAAADGRSREELLADRGIARGTLKKHVQNLLKKTGDASIVAAVARLLRERGEER
jgi:DNA-binding NarL/FixJ family response regulator